MYICKGVVLLQQSYFWWEDKLSDFLQTVWYVCLPEVCFLLRCTANSSILLCFTLCKGKKTHTPPPASQTHMPVHVLGTHKHFSLLISSIEFQSQWALILWPPKLCTNGHTHAHSHINQHDQIMRSDFCSFVVFSLPPAVSPKHSGQELAQRDRVIWAISYYLGPHTALTPKEKEKKPVFNLSYIHQLHVTGRKNLWLKKKTLLFAIQKE